MSNKLSDKEFMREYAKWQYEQYPEILDRESKLNYEIDKMMMNRQNINLEAKKQDKPCISSSSSHNTD